MTVNEAWDELYEANPWDELTAEDMEDLYGGILEQEHLKYEQWRYKYEQVA